MRPLESKQEEERKRKRNQWIIGGIMIVVMLGSTFGYAFYQLGNKDNVDNSKVDYNGYKFVNQNDFWLTTIGSYQFMFRYNPTEVEKINTTINYLSSYSGKPVYVFSEDYVAANEIYTNLGSVVQRFQGACLEDKNCPTDWPIKDCSSNFIIIKKANESRIYQDQNCVFIEGKEGNLTQITDEFLFKMMGIEG
jgi:hypothetical protein